jgi:hypothetical protein
VYPVIYVLILRGSGATTSLIEILGTEISLTTSFLLSLLVYFNFSTEFRFTFDFSIHMNFSIFPIQANNSKTFNIFWDCKNLQLISLVIDCNQSKTQKIIKSITIFNNLWTQSVSHTLKEFVHVSMPIPLRISNLSLEKNI